MAITKASDLAERFRIDVDDAELPGSGSEPSGDSLWSDDDVYYYMDQAQKEVARRTRAIVDSTTASICQATVTADEASVDLSPLIVDIRRARLSTAGVRIYPKGLDQLLDDYVDDDYGHALQGNYLDALTGTPRYIVLDMDVDKGRLVPIPVSSDTLLMDVYRLPLNDITDGYDSLELTNDRHIRAMLLYMKHLAYAKQDVDVYDPNQSAKFLIEFEQACLEIEWEQHRRRRGSRSVRYGGL